MPPGSSSTGLGLPSARGARTETIVNEDIATSSVNTKIDLFVFRPNAA